MLIIEPFNTKYLEGCKEKISDRKQNKKLKILQQMLWSFIEFERCICHLLQSIKNDQQRNDDVVWVDV